MEMQGRQLGDHLPWRCLQKVLPRAKANKARETRDRLGPVGAASLPLPLSALPSPPSPFNDHNAPLHAIFVASKGSKGFECLFGLYLLYL